MIDPKLKKQTIKAELLPEIPNYIYNTNVDTIVFLLNANKNKNPITDFSLLQILKDRCEYKEVSIDGYEFKDGKWVRKKNSTPESYVTVHLKSKPLIARMYYLATCKDSDGISEFIYDFPKVDAANIYGEKALKEMIKLKNWRAIKYLIENGVYIDTKADNNDTAFILAVRTQHLSMIKYLLDHGANVNEKGYDGYNAILLATEKNNISIVKCLVEHGVDVNVTIYKTERNRLIEHISPLCQAIINDNYNMVKYLLEYGADPYKKYKYDSYFKKNAYELAKNKGNSKIIDLLNKEYN
ncbi:ankyrin [Neocallimastix californiae]|uniref:Ankyrin n=1 Tax=Neocallimastix californiae TaxID=1754190 RepID=A0A1Y2DWL4_9FUNG|nr:ankyrin [Neocallimastix californiae]|eukprot:ORY63637.1 ankyrin [Neocallimastix californiae]